MVRGELSQARRGETQIRLRLYMWWRVEANHTVERDRGWRNTKSVCKYIVKGVGVVVYQQARKRGGDENADR